MAQLKAEGGFASLDANSVEQAQSEAFKLMSFIKAYMTHGHLVADLDPLQLDQMEAAAQYQKPNSAMRDLVNWEFYGFTSADLDREFYVDVPQLGGILQKKKKWTLRELD